MISGTDRLLRSFVRFGYQLCICWWFLTRPHTRGVKCLVFRGTSDILLVKQSYGDSRWSVPGGGVKAKESAIAAAHRELKEETGLQTELRHIGTYQQQIEYKNDTVEVFTGVLTGCTEVTIDNREIVAYEWFSTDNLPTDCRPSVRKIVALLENAEM